MDRVLHPSRRLGGSIGHALGMLETGFPPPWAALGRPLRLTVSDAIGTP